MVAVNFRQGVKAAAMVAAGVSTACRAQNTLVGGVSAVVVLVAAPCPALTVEVGENVLHVIDNDGQLGVVDIHRMK